MSLLWRCRVAGRAGTGASEWWLVRRSAFAARCGLESVRASVARDESLHGRFVSALSAWERRALGRRARSPCRLQNSQRRRPVGGYPAAGRRSPVIAGFLRVRPRPPRLRGPVVRPGPSPRSVPRPAPALRRLLPVFPRPARRSQPTAAASGFMIPSCGGGPTCFPVSCGCGAAGKASQHGASGGRGALSQLVAVCGKVLRLSSASLPARVMPGDRVFVCLQGHCCQQVFIFSALVC